MLTWKNRSNWIEINGPKSTVISNYIYSWWFFQPIWKSIIKLDHFPQVSGANHAKIQYLKPPPWYQSTESTGSLRALMVLSYEQEKRTSCVGCHFTIFTSCFRQKKTWEFCKKNTWILRYVVVLRHVAVNKVNLWWINHELLQLVKVQATSLRFLEKINLE